MAWTRVILATSGDALLALRDEVLDRIDELEPGILSEETSVDVRLEPLSQISLRYARLQKFGSHSLERQGLAYLLARGRLETPMPGPRAAVFACRGGGRWRMVTLKATTATGAKRERRRSSSGSERAASHQRTTQHFAEAFAEWQQGRRCDPLTTS
jgi:hypothetical protein